LSRFDIQRFKVIGELDEVPWIHVGASCSQCSSIAGSIILWSSPNGCDYENCGGGVY
jgi:hypothetical protein